MGKGMTDVTRVYPVSCQSSCVGQVQHHWVVTRVKGARLILLVLFFHSFCISLVVSLLRLLQAYLGGFTSLRVGWKPAALLQLRNSFRAIPTPPGPTPPSRHPPLATCFRSLRFTPALACHLPSHSPAHFANFHRHAARLLPPTLPNIPCPRVLPNPPPPQPHHHRTPNHSQLPRPLRCLAPPPALNPQPAATLAATRKLVLGCPLDPTAIQGGPLAAQDLTLQIRRWALLQRGCHPAAAWELLLGS